MSRETDGLAVPGQEGNTATVSVSRPVERMRKVLGQVTRIPHSFIAENGYQTCCARKCGITSLAKSCIECSALRGSIPPICIHMTRWVTPVSC